MNNDDLRIKIDFRKDSQSIARIINSISEYLESDNPVPDHWDEDKRRDFYLYLNLNLSVKSRAMIEKIYSVFN